MPKSIRIIISFLLLGVFISSCSEFQKIQKSEDLDYKLKSAFRYYDKKDYYKANVLFEEIIPLIKGKQDAEKAEFYFAWTFFHDKQYVMSSYYFREFYQTYPRSALAEESMFMHIKSLYKDSPVHKLDQTSTVDALNSIQRFVNKYPRSQYIEEINSITDALNTKLEQKSYENAKIYHKIGNHKSAVVAFDNFLKTYPSSTYNEEILFLKLDSQYNLARMSVPGQKQQDRYYEAVEFYQEFVDAYPKSRYKKAAESIFNSCTDKINTFI